MNHIKRVNENVSIKSEFIVNVDDLIDRLQYLKSFVNDKVDEDDINFFGKINTVYTDIQLLSGKLKYDK